MNETDNARQFCRQQIERHDPLFRLTHTFTDPVVADRVLALNAFLAATGEICAMVTDESVAARKLAWWHAEMHGGAGSGRPHPITSELRRTGAYELLDRSSLGHHFEQASDRIDPAPITSPGELVERCIAIGRPALEMEFSVCRVALPEDPWLDSVAARKGFIQLVREDFGRNDSWWLPLDMLARFGLTKSEAGEAVNAPVAQDLMQALFEHDDLGPLIVNTNISIDKQLVRRVICEDVLLQRKLKNRNFTSYIKRRELLAKAGPLDAFACWRAARRVSPLK